MCPSDDVRISSFLQLNLLPTPFKSSVGWSEFRVWHFAQSSRFRCVLIWKETSTIVVAVFPRLLQFICHARNVYVKYRSILYTLTIEWSAQVWRSNSFLAWIVFRFLRFSIKKKPLDDYCLRCVSACAYIRVRVSPALRERWRRSFGWHWEIKDFFFLVEPRGLDTGKPLGRQNWVTLRLWPTLLT
jgi:hypothetical protein